MNSCVLSIAPGFLIGTLQLSRPSLKAEVPLASAPPQRETMPQSPAEIGGPVPAPDLTRLRAELVVADVAGGGVFDQFNDSSYTDSR